MQKEDFINTIEWLRSQSTQACTLNKTMEQLQNQVEQIDLKVEATMDTLATEYGEEVYYEIEDAVHSNREKKAEELWDSLKDKLTSDHHGKD